MSRFAVVTFNDMPTQAQTLKYEVLGELSLLSHRLYAERHGYDFIDRAEIDRSRPVCWAKLPAISRALEEHEWVLWADSDTLVSEMSLPLEDLIDANYDLLAQDQEFWWELIGIEHGNDRFPINSGVFLIKSSPWSLHFLEEAHAQTRYVTHGATWDGIGDQEAMNCCIRANPDYRRRTKYLPKLQISPKLFQPGYLLVHFYGDHARHHIPAHECADVIQRWEAAITAGRTLPVDKARFHWCCIQNKSPSEGLIWADLEHYLYTVEDLRAP